MKLLLTLLLTCILMNASAQTYVTVKQYNTDLANQKKALTDSFNKRFADYDKKMQSAITTLQERSTKMESAIDETTLDIDTVYFKKFNGKFTLTDSALQKNLLAYILDSLYKASSYATRAFSSNNKRIDWTIKRLAADSTTFLSIDASLKKIIIPDLQPIKTDIENLKTSDAKQAGWIDEKQLWFNQACKQQQ